VYDGHGNMIACLFKNGSSYSINDQRSYDAWGNIRAGNTTGDPKARYVANLGHLADDESGLTYMRARYYEPSSGRFVSEDIASDGKNWYVYCHNVPIAKVDFSGKEGWELTDAQLSQMLERMSVNILQGGSPTKVLACTALLFIYSWLMFDEVRGSLSLGRYDDYVRRVSWISTFQGEAWACQSNGFGSVKDKAKAFNDTYAMMILLTLWVIELDM
jgi:RHS repeat-associated protein